MYPRPLTMYSRLPMEEMKYHVLERIRPEFGRGASPGDILVAGNNFGCGSSRETAPVAIKALGISAVIAESFARIFFRNAINIGLPILECAAAVEGVQAGQMLEVELETGQIRVRESGQLFQAGPFPPFMLDLIRAGGLIEYTKQKMSRRRS